MEEELNKKFDHYRLNLNQLLVLEIKVDLEIEIVYQEKRFSLSFLTNLTIDLMENSDVNYILLID